jgi:tripartite-type tricarboxylate transporter receptor subunit TctC
VHPSLPVRSVKELIDLAKAQPGKIDAAIPGSGTGGHLALELFMSMSGTTFTQVAHKGAAPAAGTVRALGQSGATRSPLLPDVPTIAEAGLPGYEASVYNALLGPAGLPRDIANKLQAEVAKAGRRADVQERFAQLGITMTASTPEELADFIKIETAKWAKIIREAGIKSQ